MIQSFAPQWYVAQTHPRAEEKAAAHLARQGFPIYLPRYLFVAVDMAAQRWRSIQSTVGVMQLVRNGEAPAAVSNRIVEELKNRECGLGFIQLDQSPTFRLGDKLRVIDGVFCDSHGSFEGMSDGERVTILLDLLGRKVRVRLDAEFVTAA